MTVNELIEQLKNYPSDMRVLTFGYEGGFNDIRLNTDDIVFNDHDKDAWYYGPHESLKFAKGNDSTKCLIIERSR